MKILAIDPGCKESAYIIFNTATENILDHGHVGNYTLLGMCKDVSSGNFLAIERIEGFGMTAGQELFDTCFWSGRFCQAWQELHGANWQGVGRKSIKINVCGHSTAKDKDIREALIHRYGEQGTKSNPGKLYGISGHCWSALAVAVTYLDKEILKKT